MAAVPGKVLTTALLVAMWMPGAWSQAVTVMDDDGREISLQQPASRIISLAPSMTELLFAAGAGDKLVGVSEYSDYPSQASEIEIIGRFDLINTEAILTLEPDLIVAWRSGNPRAAVQRLIDLGFNVYIAEPTTLDSIPEHLRQLAMLAGTEAAGFATAQDLDQRLNAMNERYRDVESISVFYQVWNEPLITVGGRELINDMIALCGGTNIFADQGLAPKISVEAVLQRRPEVIIASGMDISRPEWLDDWRRWPQLPAVSNDNLYHIPPDLVQRHTPRALDGAEQMCTQLDQARQKINHHGSGDPSSSP